MIFMDGLFLTDPFSNSGFHLEYFHYKETKQRNLLLVSLSLKKKTKPTNAKTPKQQQQKKNPQPSPGHKTDLVLFTHSFCAGRNCTSTSAEPVQANRPSWLQHTRKICPPFHIQGDNRPGSFWGEGPQANHPFQKGSVRSRGVVRLQDNKTLFSCSS